MVKIIEVNSVGTTLVESLKVLIPQLSPFLRVPTEADLNRIINSENTRLFVAQDGSGCFVGMLTLVWYYAPSGCHAWIEDVAVDSAHRGKGIGELLVEKSIEVARSVGAKKVSLTSNPTRVAAHGLYQKLNFEKRDSTLMVLNLDNY